MKYILPVLLALPILLFAQTEITQQEMGLEELNEYLFSEYALRKNTQPLNDVATDDFILIAAPGMIENKQQAIDGVANLNISEVEVTVDKTMQRDNIGVVIGVLVLKGTINDRPVPGKIRYTSTFIKEEGQWRLLSRSMTPIRGKS